MTENEKKAILELSGNTITEDEFGNICLNDLWVIAEKPKDLRPPNWARQKRTKALKSALVERIMFLEHKPQEEVEKSIYYVSGRGGGARTYAHPVLALEYAENINPSIGLDVKELFLKYRSDPISLANDIFDRIAEQVEEDEIRLKNRDEITIRNKELAQQGAKAGCSKYDYAELHNSGYRGLYNGLDAVQIHRLKKLTKNQKILDHMNAAEGAANVFRVTQAKIAMQQRQPKTPEEVFNIAHEAGVRTRQAMAEIGGVMPEKMKPADSIKEAKKRLGANKTLLEKD